MRSYSSNVNPFSQLAIISDHGEETEILLLPGVIFQVKKLEFDNEKERHLMFIKIKSSHISKLL